MSDQVHAFLTWIVQRIGELSPGLFAVLLVVIPISWAIERIRLRRYRELSAKVEKIGREKLGALIEQQKRELIYRELRKAGRKGYISAKTIEYLGNVDVPKPSVQDRQ